MNTQIHKSRSGIIFGIALILLGGAFIARNTGLIPQTFHSIIVSWQMMLIIIGVISIVKRRACHFWGLAIICTGIFFIIPKLARIFPSAFGYIDADVFVSVYWPILMIVSGAILILHIPAHHHCKHFHNRFRDKHNAFCGYQNSPSAENCSQDEDFSKTCIFGGGNYIIIDTEFRGGTLQAIFGGIELNLRKAYLPEGETTLTIEAIFGSVSLFVPENWCIDETAVESVLGGIDDKRRITETVDSTRKLIIKGSAVFGSIEIRN
jgi:predicted membrane protein